MEIEELLKRYKNAGFSDEQLDEIQKGLVEGFDVSIYARVNIPASEMAYIRKYLFYKKGIKEEEQEALENPEDIEKDFEKYKEAKGLSVYEKIITFAITIAGLAILSFLFEMLIMLSKL